SVTCVVLEICALQKGYGLSDRILFVKNTLIAATLCVFGKNFQLTNKIPSKIPSAPVDLFPHVGAPHAGRHGYGIHAGITVTCCRPASVCLLAEIMRLAALTH